MKVVVLCLLLSASVVAQEPRTAAVPSEMTVAISAHEKDAIIWDLQQKNIALQSELIETQKALLNLRGARLRNERVEIEQKLRDAVQAPTGATVDWSVSPPVVRWPEKK